MYLSSLGQLNFCFSYNLTVLGSLLCEPEGVCGLWLHVCLFVRLGRGEKLLTKGFHRDLIGSLLQECDAVYKTKYIVYSILYTVCSPK